VETNNIVTWAVYHAIFPTGDNLSPVGYRKMLVHVSNRKQDVYSCLSCFLLTTYPNLLQFVMGWLPTVPDFPDLRR